MKAVNLGSLGFTARIFIFFCAVLISFSACPSPDDVSKDAPSQKTDDFVQVTDITGMPTTAIVGTPLSLTGTVVPSHATNQDITWTVKHAGTTGATITGNKKHSTDAGTVIVTATINHGIAQGSHFTKDFTITVTHAFVAVSDITNVPTTATAKTPLSLSG